MEWVSNNPWLSASLIPLAIFVVLYAKPLLCATSVDVEIEHLAAKADAQGFGREFRERVAVMDLNPGDATRIYRTMCSVFRNQGYEKESQ